MYFVLKMSYEGRKDHNNSQFPLWDGMLFILTSILSLAIPSSVQDVAANHLEPDMLTSELRQLSAQLTYTHQHPLVSLSNFQIDTFCTIIVYSCKGQ